MHPEPFLLSSILKKLLPRFLSCRGAVQMCILTTCEDQVDQETTNNKALSDENPSIHPKGFFFGIVSVLYFFPCVYVCMYVFVWTCHKMISWLVPFLLSPFSVSRVVCSSESCKERLFLILSRYSFFFSYFLRRPTGRQGKSAERTVLCQLCFFILLNPSRVPASWLGESGGVNLLTLHCLKEVNGYNFSFFSPSLSNFYIHIWEESVAMMWLVGYYYDPERISGKQAKLCACEYVCV